MTMKVRLRCTVSVYAGVTVNQLTKEESKMKKMFKLVAFMIVGLVFMTGCSTVSDLVGLNYDSEKEYRAAVDARIAKRDIDPVLAVTVKEKLYSLWQADRQTVLDSYELDEALKTVIINKLTE